MLYREFVRSASELHPWFELRELEPSRCKGAVAFPSVKESNAQRLQACRTLGEAFLDPVEIIQLEQT